jgi:putative transposase
VGWSLREDMTRDIVIDALRMAWFKRHPSKQAGLIFHSDRGSQYASHDFRDVLKEYGITASMSRRGDCWDTQSTIGLSAVSSLTRAGIGVLPLR